jgi:hypothetical protein
MAIQNESAEWTGGVYRIQKMDETVGFYSDVAGINNMPLEDFAKRTCWLKAKIGDVEALLWQT